MFFSIFDRYLGKVILKSIVVILFFFISLSVLIKFISELHKIDQYFNNILGLLLFIIFNVPSDIEAFLPICVLLGTLLGLSILMSNNELIAMEAGGYGYFKIMGSIFKSVILMILFIVFFTESILSLSDRFSYFVRDHLFSKYLNVDMKNNLWIRNNGNFIFIERVINTRELSGISIYFFDKKDGVFQLCRIWYAQSALFVNGIWSLVKVDEYYFNDIECLLVKHSLNELWETTLTPEILLSTITKLRSLSIFLLFKYIKYLDRDGQRSDVYKIHFWSKIFSPFSSLVMMFFGIAFIFNNFYNAKMNIGIKMLFGVFFSFSFYVLNKVCVGLGILYNVTPVISGIIPIFVFLVIGVFMLFKCN